MPLSAGAMDMAEGIVIMKKVGNIFWWVLGGLLLVSLWQHGIAANEISGTSGRIRTAVGNDLAIIHHSEVILKNLEAAMDLWYEEFTKKVGVSPQYFFYRDIQQLVADFNAGKLDIIDTTSLNFLRIRPEIAANMAPDIYGVIKGGKKTHHYLLLTRADSGILSLKDLKNDTIFIQENDDTGRFFVNTMLLKNGLAHMERFFAEIQETKTLASAILSVFFNKGQVCVTTDDIFDTMVELNPQVGKQLRILETSPEIVNGVFFFHKNYDLRLKKDALNEALNFEKTTYGQQVLLLYKIDRLVPLDEADLAPVANLLHEYNFLRQQYSGDQQP